MNINNCIATSFSASTTIRLAAFARASITHYKSYDKRQGQYSYIAIMDLLKSYINLYAVKGH